RGLSLGKKASLGFLRLRLLFAASGIGSGFGVLLRLDAGGLGLFGQVRLTFAGGLGFGQAGGGFALAGFVLGRLAGLVLALLQQRFQGHVVRVRLQGRARDLGRLDVLAVFLQLACLIEDLFALLPCLCEASLFVLGSAGLLGQLVHAQLQFVVIL